METSNQKGKALGRYAPLLVVVVLVLLVAACGAAGTPTPAPTPTPVPTPTKAPRVAQTVDTVSFARDILPVFRETCASCHGAASPSSGLSLETYAGVKKGSNDGEVVFACFVGDPLCKGTFWCFPHRSLLYAHLTSGKMPKDGVPLADNDIRNIGA